MKKTAIFVLIAMMLAPIAAYADAGADTFKAKCQMCHGPDGKKNPKVDLSGPDVQGKSEGDLVKFLTTDAKHKSKVADEAAAKEVVKFLKTLK